MFCSFCVVLLYAFSRQTDAPSERSVYVTESLDRYCALIAAPIISEGDALGLVVFVGTEEESNAGETEYKLAQAIAGFLGKHMEC